MLTCSADYGRLGLGITGDTDASGIVDLADLRALIFNWLARGD